MPLTEAQLEKRRQHVGGSDVPRLANGQAHDVWLEKVHKTDGFTNPAMEAGTLLENSVLDWAERELGPFKRDFDGSRQVTLYAEDSPLATNADAVIESSGVPVEAKTTGLVGPVYGEWGEEGTDEIPGNVILQCHAHMVAAKAQVCHVPTLIGGRGFVMFRVERDDGLCQRILEMVETFWQYVVDRVPPGDEWGQVSAPSLSVLKRIAREPGKILPAGAVNVKTVEQWEQAKACKRFIEKGCDALQAEVLAQLGDATGAVLKDGRYLEMKTSNVAAGYRKAYSRTVATVKKSPPLLENHE